MQTKIDLKGIADMANSLSNDELGAAVRLMSRILSTEKGVTEARARTVCQMDEESWRESSREILAHFIVDGTIISHRSLEDMSMPAVSKQPSQRAGVTADLPIVHVMRNNTVPNYSNRDKPELLSMRKTAYDMMVAIFARSEQSENSARKLLASLLTTWKDGAVYEAISAADKEKFLVDPRSWIIKWLQKNHTPLASGRARRDECPPPVRKAAPRQIVTPEATGVSSGTAQKIRDRNANLRLNIGTKTQDA